MKAYKHLVKHAIDLGFVVSVYDGEEWAVKRSKKQKDIFAAIESVEEAQLRFRNPKLEKGSDSMGWALVSAFGLNDDETVIDHNTYDESEPNSIKFQWLDTWSNEYDKTLK
jgi:hypothetical protein